MFRSKTVFIVGAGASQEVGLPTGAELKDIIAEKLNIKYDFRSENPYVPVSGDAGIAAILAEYARSNSQDFNHYLEEAWKIVKAIPQAISIDNLMHAHRGNSALELCGKLAIARAILESESKSALYVDEPSREPFNPENIKGTWFENFFRILHEDVTRDAHLGSIFENVTFINFNYDRCIEQFLYYSLPNYYHVGESDAIELISNLTILRPYGLVGPLPWQDRRCVPFGGRYAGGMSLLDIASQIKTFTERSEDNAARETIRAQVENADTLVFLGFGFHSLNMELIKPSRGSVRRVFATAKGISDADIQVITGEVINTWLSNLHNPNFDLRVNNKVSCCDLFTEYWLSLSQG